MPPEAGLPEDWVRYARSDLEIAEGPPGPHVLLEMLCFHARQAAEKGLKAGAATRFSAEERSARSYAGGRGPCTPGFSGRWRVPESGRQRKTRLRWEEISFCLACQSC